MRFKIDRASLKLGSKFKVFALFYFVFEGNFPNTSPGGLYLEGRFNGGFFALPVWGLIFGGAYTWRGLFSEFYGSLNQNKVPFAAFQFSTPTFPTLLFSNKLQS